MFEFMRRKLRRLKSIKKLRENSNDCVKTAKSADCACGCRCTRECDDEAQRIGKQIGDHITNTIFTKNRIVRNSQNPGNGV